jgi:3-hydroxyacyl-[acyl-carrier-protein] dehydratase
MYYPQLDGINELIPGQSIVASRRLRAEEDYLKDHFPLFPVMPGVMMLEALYQAGAFLVHATEGFQSARVSLTEVRNARFADFMQPGQTLEIKCELVKSDGPVHSLKAAGYKNGSLAVTARMTLTSSNVSSSETFPGDDLEGLNQFMQATAKRRLETLKSQAAAS